MLQGILDLIAAAIAIFVPIATILAFVYLNAAWAIVTGVLMLAAVSRLHRMHGKWILALGAVLSHAGATGFGAVARSACRRDCSHAQRHVVIVRLLRGAVVDNRNPARSSQRDRAALLEIRHSAAHRLHR
jgi:hypothetical protein